MFVFVCIVSQKSNCKSSYHLERKENYNSSWRTQEGQARSSWFKIQENPCFPQKAYSFRGKEIDFKTAKEARQLQGEKVRSYRMIMSVLIAKRLTRCFCRLNRYALIRNLNSWRERVFPIHYKWLLSIVLIHIDSCCSAACRPLISIWAHREQCWIFLKIKVMHTPYLWRLRVMGECDL